jgi:hypothetical protein
MPTIIPEDFGVLTFHHTDADAQGAIVNTLGVAVPSSNEALNTVNHAAAAWSNIVMPVLCNNLIFTGASLLIRRSDLLEHWDSNVEAPQAGGHGADCLPLNCSYLVQKKTAFAGKRNRGRWYLAGADKNAVTGSTVGATMKGIIQTALDAFGNEIKDDETTYQAPMLPVILHGSAGAPTEINNFVVESRLATQRGRMRD